MTLSLNDYHHDVSHKGKRGDKGRERLSCLFSPKKVSCHYFLSFFISILITGTFPTQNKRRQRGFPLLVALPTWRGGAYPHYGFLSFWPNWMCKCSFWVFLWPNHLRIDQIERAIAPFGQFGLSFGLTNPPPRNWPKQVRKCSFWSILAFLWPNQSTTTSNWPNRARKFSVWSIQAFLCPTTSKLAKSSAEVLVLANLVPNQPPPPQNWPKQALVHSFWLSLA